MILHLIELLLAHAGVPQSNVQNYAIILMFFILSLLVLYIRWVFWNPATKDLFFRKILHGQVEPGKEFGVGVTGDIIMEPGYGTTYQQKRK